MLTERFLRELQGQVDMTDADERWMAAALGLAELGRGQTSPNPLVGCVLVADGEIVGQGAHLKAGHAHAEVNALKMAGERAAGSTAYVTLEPCSHYGRTPPCADALIRAGVKRVVVALLDPDARVAGQGLQKLRDAGISVQVGVLESLARRQNAAYLMRIGQRRPYVVWKTASTLDGRIATSTGHSQFVTGTKARLFVHGLRAELDSIGVGIGTVLADDPQLTVRISDTTHARQPLRVVFDSSLRTPVTARVFSQPGKTVVYTTVSHAAHSYQTSLPDSGAATVDIVALRASADGRVPIRDALHDLADRGVNSLLLEGGGTLAGAFLSEQLIDEVIWFVAPKLLGGGIPVLSGLNPVEMKDAFHLQDVSSTAVGEDLCIQGKPIYDSHVDEEARR